MENYINYSRIENENMIGLLFCSIIPVFFFIYLVFFLTPQRTQLNRVSYIGFNSIDFTITKMRSLIAMLLSIAYIFFILFKNFPEIKIFTHIVGMQFNGKIFIFELCLILLFCVLCYLTLKYRTELKKEYILLFYFFIFASLNLVMQTNLIGIFLLIEMFSLSSYIIIAAMGNKIAIEGALKYALMGMFSSALLMISLVFFLLNYGTLNLAEIAILERYNYIENIHSTQYITFCTIFFL